MNGCLLHCVRTRRFVPTGLENIFGFRIDVALSSFGDQLYVFSHSDRHAEQTANSGPDLVALHSGAFVESSSGRDEMMFGKRPNAPEELRSLPDEALCHEATAGNHDAFLVLFDRYCEDVFRLAYSVLRNKAEAEDLVQGLFLEVHTTMLRYDEQRGSFRTLLLRYAYTRAIDHRRHLESRRYYTSLQIEEVDPETLGQHSALTSGLSPEEGTHLIEQALNHLDAKQRAAVTAYFFRGLSLNEIAHELDESFGNARHHLYRGLERMRRVLAPKDEAEESSEPDRNIILKLHARPTKRVAPEVSVARARSI